MLSSVLTSHVDTYCMYLHIRMVHAYFPQALLSDLIHKAAFSQVMHVEPVTQDLLK